MTTAEMSAALVPPAGPGPDAYCVLARGDGPERVYLGEGGRWESDVANALRFADGDGAAGYVAFDRPDLAGVVSVYRVTPAAP